MRTNTIRLELVQKPDSEAHSSVSSVDAPSVFLFVSCYLSEFIGSGVVPNYQHFFLNETFSLCSWPTLHPHNETVMRAIYIILKYYFKHGEAYSSTVSDDTWDPTCINRIKENEKRNWQCEWEQSKGGRWLALPGSSCEKCVAFILLVLDHLVQNGKDLVTIAIWASMTDCFC